MKIVTSVIARIQKIEKWDVLFKYPHNPSTPFLNALLIGFLKAVLVLALFTSLLLTSLQLLFTLGWCFIYLTKRDAMTANYSWFFNAPANENMVVAVFSAFMILVGLGCGVIALARFGGWSPKN